MVQNNIFWIILDGVRNYPTPNDPEKMGKPEILDKVSIEGVEFLQATTSGTSTLMAITAMLTSIPSYYLSRNLDDLKLDRSNFESIANILEDKGYNIYSVSMSYEMRREYWKTFMRPVDRSFWPKGCKVMEHWSNEPLNSIIFEMLDKKALREPFFLYVHYNFRRDYECNERVEALLSRLKKEGLYDDSVLIMNSDHGMPDSERRDYFKWLDERGLYFNRHDLIMTDDNICVPLVVKYPGCQAGKKIDITVGLIDVVPTILDILKIPFGKDKKYGSSFRGESLLPLIHGEKVDHYRSRKIRTDTRYIAQTDRIISLRGTGYKYVYFRDVVDGENAQFYDLAKDSVESENLIHAKDKKYTDLINEYKQAYIDQERDAVQYQIEFLKRKFEKQIDISIPNKQNVDKIIVIGSCNFWFLNILNEILKDTFSNLARCDLFIERDNPAPYHQINDLGFSNNIFAHHAFDAKEFKKDYLSTFAEYDLLIAPLTDYKKDFDQAKTKNTQGAMEMIQPQAPISSRILKDYEQVFSIVNLIRAEKKLFVDYNMNLFRRPRTIIYSRYLKKMLAKKDIYMYRPVELIRDVKRLLLKK